MHETRARAKRRKKEIAAAHVVAWLCAARAFSDIMSLPPSLTLRVEADGVLNIDGQLPKQQTSTAPAKRATTTQKKSEPYPQALDGQPDHVVVTLPQVADDSKPKLAESLGVLQLPPPMLSTGQRLF